MAQGQAKKTHSNSRGRTLFKKKATEERTERTNTTEGTSLGQGAEDVVGEGETTRHLIVERWNGKRSLQQPLWAAEKARCGLRGAQTVSRPQRQDSGTNWDSLQGTQEGSRGEGGVRAGPRQVKSGAGNLIAIKKRTWGRSSMNF